MAIENSVSNDFYLRSSIVLAFSIFSYPVWGSRRKTSKKQKNKKKKKESAKLI